MTNLYCNAENCVHNEAQRCRLQKIHVCGDDCACAEETCCDSFSDVQDRGVTSVVTESQREAETETDIVCSAFSCVHNENGDCHARKVDIAGHGAMDSKETCCRSFADV